MVVAKGVYGEYTLSGSSNDTKMKVLPVDTTAIEAKDISKAHTGPLRIFHTTIRATIITRKRFHNRLVGRSHLNHLDGPDKFLIRAM